MVAIWEIVELETEADIRGFKDVIVEIHWRIPGTEYYGSTSIHTDNLDKGFKPLAAVTHSNAVTMLHKQLNKSIISKSVSEFDALIANSPVKTRSKRKL